MTVEFSSPHDDEEELPSQRGPRRARLRTDLAAGAAVLLAVLLASRAISRHEGGPAPSATATPSGPRTPVEIVGPTRAPTTPAVPAPSSYVLTRPDGRTVTRPALPPRAIDDPALCPAGLSCFTQDAVPGNVIAAVQHVFPAARVLAEQTVRLLTNPWAGQIWFRQLNFRVSGSELVVRIYRRGPRDDRGGGVTGGGIVFYATSTREYVIATQIGPAATGTVDKLRRLAHDPRLLTT